MDQSAKDIVPLLLGFMEGTLTEEETRLLAEWKDQSTENLAFFERVTDPAQLQLLLRDYYRVHAYLDASPSKTDIQPAIVAPLKHSTFRKLYWIAAACTIVLITTICAYLLFSPVKDKPTVTKTAASTQPDVGPGGQKATLILADQSQVNLTLVPTGTIARQGETVLQKTDDGHLRYEGQNAAGMNTLLVPRGGFFQLTFSDGSKVTLNAASSIRYPVVFAGNERRIELLQGEIYLEVSKNAQKPFIVQQGSYKIEVLGTKFNVKSYDNDPATVATLLEGSIKVSTGSGQSKVIVPGQQALVPRAQTAIHVDQVDAEASIAWVQHTFHFGTGTTLLEISRQLERWYDVDIELKGDVVAQAGEIKGTVSSNIPLSSLLKNLSRVGQFKYIVKGKKVELLPAEP